MDANDRFGLSPWDTILIRDGPYVYLRYSEACTCDPKNLQLRKGMEFHEIAWRYWDREPSLIYQNIGRSEDFNISCRV